jgi:hypothetical protein
MLHIAKAGNTTGGYFISATEKVTIPNSSGRIQLLLGESNNDVYVKELEVGTEGVAYLYSPPKFKK